MVAMNPTSMILPTCKVPAMPATATRLRLRTKQLGQTRRPVQSILNTGLSFDGGYGVKSLEIECWRPALPHSRDFAAKVFFGNGDFLQGFGVGIE
jgi:hypothetical protein